MLKYVSQEEIGDHGAKILHVLLRVEMELKQGIILFNYAAFCVNRFMMLFGIWRRN